MLYERGQRQIWLVWAYLGSFFRPEGVPYGMVHLDTDKNGGHDVEFVDIPLDILG